MCRSEEITEARDQAATHVFQRDVAEKERPPVSQMRTELVRIGHPIAPISIRFIKKATRQLSARANPGRLAPPHSAVATQSQIVQSRMMHVSNHWKTCFLTRAIETVNMCHPGIDFTVDNIFQDFRST